MESLGKYLIENGWKYFAYARSLIVFYLFALLVLAYPLWAGEDVGGGRHIRYDIIRYDTIRRAR